MAEVRLPLRPVERPGPPCVADPKRRDPDSSNHVLVLYGKRMCAVCPHAFRRDCLAEGLREDAQVRGGHGAPGLYGGLTARERIMMTEGGVPVRVCASCGYEYVSRSATGFCTSCVSIRDSRDVAWDVPPSRDVVAPRQESPVARHRDDLIRWRREVPARSWGWIASQVGNGVTRNAVAKWYKRNIEGREDYGR